MKHGSFVIRELDGREGARLVIASQLLVLAALVIGLQFVLRTTGGTLFLAATVAPCLTAIAILITGAALIYRYRKRHSLFTTAVFEPGEIIFQAGDVSDSAYFIRSGDVEVVRRDSGGEVIVAVLSSGEYFGEMAVLSDAPRNATVRARTLTVTEAVGKENFLAMLNAVRGAREDVMKTVEKRSAAAESSKPPAV